MEKGKTDLSKINQKANIPMTFAEFFPIFRDSILGLIFMHINNIAHRDIKPGNIMKMSDNRYVIVDYGEGVSLTYQEQYKDGNDFQIGKWHI